MTGFEIAILFIIVYWLFGPRVIAMVDVLSTRVQTIYDTWNRHAFTQPDLSLFPSVKRQVAMRRRQRDHDVAFGRDNQLSSVKSAPWQGFPQKPRTQHKEPCTSCDTNLQNRAAANNPNDADLINILDIKERSSPNVFVRFFADLVHNYNCNRHHFAEIQDSVITDDRVQDAISETVNAALIEADGEPTEAAYTAMLAKYTRKARGVVKYMHAAMSNLMLKITSYVLYKLLPRCITSVSVHPAQIEMIKKATQTRVPIVYVPLHRSHLDYILIIFTILNSAIRPPLTAAGINLNIPVFGILLRWLGAFYIKRRIEPTAGKKDLIYRAALHTYMVQCLKAGHNIKFYIEGGRTRTGKPLLPKVGLLSVIVDTFMDGTVEDVLLVPVSVNYDKLVDGNFVCEQLGQQKQKETFTSAMQAIWQTLTSSHGACAINFNEPYSLKELVKSFQSETTRVPLTADDSSHPILTSKASFSSLHGTDVVSEDHRYLVEHIANHLVFDCAEACSVMSTNVISWLLLTRFRGGVKFNDFVVQLDQLRNDLTNQRRHLGFTGTSPDVINSALMLLGKDLVKRSRNDDGEEIITPVTALPSVLELSYYSNALLPHFALSSIIATAAFGIMKKNPDQSVRNVILRHSDLISNSKDLCDILQFEFVFQRPCQQLEAVLTTALDDFASRGVITTIPTRRNYGNYGLDDEMEDDGPERLYKLNSNDFAVEEIRYSTTALRPLFDTYYMTAQALYRLNGRQITEGDYVKEVIEEIKNYLDTGLCSYAESCSVDPIRNACKLLKKWGVVETHNKDSVRLIYLSKEYDYNREALDQLLLRLSTYKYSTDLC